METTELFDSQWQVLVKKRQQLLDEAKDCKQRLNLLTEEPTMRQLLEDKTRLKKIIPKIKNEVEHKNAIQGRQQIQQELANRKYRLVHLENFKTFEIIVNLNDEFDLKERMIFKIESSLPEVDKLYQWINIKEEKNQKSPQQILDETIDYIANIEEYYRQTKHCLKVKIHEIEQKRCQCRTDEVEWATQNRSYLEWMLKHESSYRDDIVCRYRVRFPIDNLSDLFPLSPTFVPNIQKTKSKKRHSQSSSLELVVAEIAPSVQQLWMFCVTFNASELGQELPQERDQFLINLQSALNGENYRNLNIEIVYDKLMAFVGMSVYQRHKIKKIDDGSELQGWTILRTGKRHRLFLSINEKKRHIRFLPCPRRKCYSQH